MGCCFVSIASLVDTVAVSSTSGLGAGLFAATFSETSSNELETSISGTTAGIELAGFNSVVSSTASVCASSLTGSSFFFSPLKILPNFENSPPSDDSGLGCGVPDLASASKAGEGAELLAGFVSSGSAFFISSTGSSALVTTSFSSSFISFTGSGSGFVSVSAISSSDLSIVSRSFLSTLNKGFLLVDSSDCSFATDDALSGVDTTVSD